MQSKSSNCSSNDMTTLLSKPLKMLSVLVNTDLASINETRLGFNEDTYLKYLVCGSIKFICFSKFLLLCNGSFSLRTLNSLSFMCRI
jgi:hypothetical protein